jgi:acyl-coenzyme A synthetase/AMP-(fatty) acid ligase
MPEQAFPLTGRGAEEPFCHRGAAGVVTVGRFLAEAQALAARLPEAGHAVNACADRYLAILGFAAALLRGHPTVLGAGRGGAPGFLRTIAGRHPDAYAMADGPLPDAGMPVLTLGAPLDAAPSAPMPPIPASRIAAIAFTSGSTGTPSAHPKPWGALVAGAAAAAERFGLAGQPPGGIVATVPPQHMYGFETTVMLPLHAPVLVHSGDSFFPADALAALGQLPGRRILVTTPLHLRALLADGRRPPALEAVISASAPLPREVAEAVERDWGAPMLEIYGATEAGSMASRRTLREEAWTPYAGVAVGPAGAEVPGIGQVPLADAIEPEAGGRFRLLGRLADMVKLGGKRASLAELNRVLCGLEGVEDGAFVAPPDLGDNPSARLIAYAVAPG